MRLQVFAYRPDIIMGLDINETATLDGPNGPAEVSATRKWTLSADGKTLTTEMIFRSEQGSQTMKRIFVKQ